MSKAGSNGNGGLRVVKGGKGGGRKPPTDPPAAGTLASIKSPLRNVSPVYKGIAAGEWHSHRDGLGLPPDFPLTCLGVSADGSTYYFLDCDRRLRVLAINDFGLKGLSSLFSGNLEYLRWMAPRYNTHGQLTSVRTDEIMGVLHAACARRGIFDESKRMRGRGAWRTVEGKIVFHHGAALWGDGYSLETGVHEEMLYTDADPILAPAAAVAEPGPAATLLPVLRSWNWARPDTDPVLMLGWIAVALIGGALDWRPTVVLTGDKGTGKSTLLRLVKGLFGHALIESADATAAGIYQRLQFDALPVALDEFEAKGDGARGRAIMDLIRAATDNNLIMRGGHHHKGVQFNARSAFLVSAINMPPLEPSEWSRLANLILYPLDADAAEPSFVEGELQRLGSQILRRMLDAFQRFPAVVAGYREALKAGGHDARGQNTFGTLLAGADLLVGNDAELLEVELGALEDHAAWSDRLRVGRLPEYENAVANWRRCLNSLLTVPVDAWRQHDQRYFSIAALLSNVQRVAANDPDLYEANQLLGRCGLALIERRKALRCADEPWLAIPNDHEALKGLFKNTPWAGGTWGQALRQAPPGLTEKTHQRIQGVLTRCTLIPLSVALDSDAGDED